MHLNYSDLYSVTSKSDYEFILSNYSFEESKLVLRPNWVLVGDSDIDIYNKKLKELHPKYRTIAKEFEDNFKSLSSLLTLKEQSML